MRFLVVYAHQGAVVGFVRRYQTIKIGGENDGFKSVVLFNCSLAISQIVGGKMFEIEVETQLTREVDI